MSMQDPVADMLVRIRNALAVAKKEVAIPASKLKVAIADVLKNEGYVLDYRIEEQDRKPNLLITLKYYRGMPVISELKRISRPGLRQYKKRGNLPKVQQGLGVAIVSTPKGVMSDRQARAIGQGGEVLCEVS
jgi:small subunit ribosomal protein S8